MLYNFLFTIFLFTSSNKKNYTQSKPSTSDDDLWKKEDSPNENDENETIEYAKAVCTVKPVLKRPGLFEDPSPNKKNQI